MNEVYFFCIICIYEAERDKKAVYYKKAHVRWYKGNKLNFMVNDNILIFSFSALKYQKNLQKNKMKSKWVNLINRFFLHELNTNGKVHPKFGSDHLLRTQRTQFENEENYSLVVHLQKKVHPPKQKQKKCRQRELLTIAAKAISDFINFIGLGYEIPVEIW